MKKCISIIIALTMIFLTFPASFAATETSMKSLFEDDFEKGKIGATLSGWANGTYTNTTGVTHTYAEDPENPENKVLRIERTAPTNKNSNCLEQGVILGEVASSDAIQRDITLEFRFFFLNDGNIPSIKIRHRYDGGEMNSWKITPEVVQAINSSGSKWISDYDIVKSNEWNTVKLLLKYDGCYTMWVNGEIVEGDNGKAENIKSTKFIPSENGGLDALLISADGTVLGTTYIDDFRVTADFSADLEAAAASLTFDMLSDEPEERITQNLNLTTELTIDDKTYPVEWLSSDENFIKTDGSVTRQSFAKDVTLTARIFTDTDKNTYKDKCFTVTVIEDGGASDETKLDQYVEFYLKEEAFTDEDKNAVTKSLSTLPAGTAGIAVGWSSSEPDIISADGTVTRPAHDDPRVTGGKAEVTLTATLTLNDAEPVAKELVYKVLALPDPAVMLQGAYDALTYDVLSQEERTRITQDLTLPNKGENDTTITWTVIEGDAISVPDGTVTRQDTSSDVTLRATIDFYGATTTRDFYFTVLPSETKMLELDIAQIDSSGWDSIEESFNLPLTGELYDSEFVWTSENAAITINEGRAVVLRPLYNEGNASFNLILAASNGEATEQKTFPVTVLEEVSSEDFVDTALEYLIFDNISEEEQNAVTLNLSLPTVLDGGVSVAWESSDDSVVTQKGEVIRPSNSDGDAVITLTPTVTKNVVTRVGTPISFTVLAYESDSDFIDSVKNSLIFSVLSSEDIGAVTTNLYLPSLWRGADVEWTSGNTSVLTVDGETGTVIRPKWGKGSAAVTLSASISYGGLTRERAYNVTVLEKDYMENIQTHMFENFEAWTDDEVPSYSGVKFSLGSESQVAVSIENDPLDDTQENQVFLMDRTVGVSGDGYVKITPNKELGGIVYIEMDVYIEDADSGTLSIQCRSSSAAQVQLYFTPQVLRAGANNISIPESVINHGDWNNISLEIDTAKRTFHVFMNGELLSGQGNVTDGDGNPYDTTDGINYASASGGSTMAEFRLKTGLEKKVMLDNIYVKEKVIFSNTQLEIVQAWEREFLENNDITNITGDLILPTRWYEGYNITYASGDSSVIDESGRFNLESGEKDVSFVVEISDAASTYKKSYILHVVKTDKIILTDADAVVADVLWAINTLKENYMLTALSQNMTFPSKGENGSDIAITSSDTDVVSNSGTITRGNSDQTITLTITASKNGSTKTDTLSVTVAKKQISTPSTQESSGGSGSSGIKITTGAQSKGDTGVEITQPEDENKNTSDFIDVSNDHWAYNEIKYLVDSGIMSGVGDGSIQPERTILREEFIKLLVSAMGIKTGDGETGFTDVAENSWYAPYIAAAKDSGILNGYEDGRAGIGEEISREDMAVMIYRAASLAPASSDNNFADDANISGYARDAVYTLNQIGIVNGMDNGEFAPMAKTTRAQTACMVYRAIKKGLFD